MKPFQKKNNRFLIACAVCFFSASVLPLTGCSAGLINSSSLGIFQRTDAHMLERNQAAADYLVQHIHTYIEHDDVILAAPLSDLEEPAIRADIGNVISEQVGSRLAELGYQVDLSQVSTLATRVQPAGAMLSAAPRFTLSGTFKRGRENLDVSLRVVENATGRVIGAFDYPLAMARDVGELSKTKPLIFRAEP